MLMKLSFCIKFVLIPFLFKLLNRQINSVLSLLMPSTQRFIVISQRATTFAVQPFKID